MKIIRTLNLQRETTAILENAYAISYEKQVNSIWQASFSLPINDAKVSKVELLKYVEIDDVGLFRIMPKLTSKSAESVTFQCEHVLSTLLDACLFKYHQMSNYTTRQVIEYLLNQQEIKHWELRRCDFNRGFHYSWENENGIVGPLFSVPKPFDEPYMWQFDTSTYPWQLDLIRPDDIPTCRIKEGYNLIDFEIEENPMNVINRIYPIGAGEGVNQLTIESVNNGVPYLEDRQPGDEIIKHIWVDRRFTNPQSLKANAQALLDEWKKPKVTWVANGADVSSITGLSIDKLEQGKIVRLQLDNYPTIDLRIMKESKADMTGDPGNVELEIGNVQEDLSTTQTDLERRQQVNELYSQGATNMDSHSFADNCDPNHPAKIRFYLDEGLVNINTMTLTYETEAFRSYSRTTKDGGGFTQPATVKSESTENGGGGTSGPSSRTTSGPSSRTTSSSVDGHRHRVFQHNRSVGTDLTPFYQSYYAPRQANGQALGEQYLPGVSGDIYTESANGSHNHEMDHNHNMDHTHTVPDHKHTVEVEIPAIEIPNHEHEIEHGIFVLDRTPSSVEIRVDGNLVPHTAINGSDIDIVPYLSKDSSGKVTRGTWHEVTIKPNDFGRVTADVISRLFIQSQLGGVY